MISRAANWMLTCANLLWMVSCVSCDRSIDTVDRAPQSLLEEASILYINTYRDRLSANDHVVKCEGSCTSSDSLVVINVIDSWLSVDSSACNQIASLKQILTLITCSDCEGDESMLSASDYVLLNKILADPKLPPRTGSNHPTWLVKRGESSIAVFNYTDSLIKYVDLPSIEVSVTKFYSR